jgi:cellulose synthase/poly-beta-1,6-N-acetylglucosamine synthase-like glycosyltransferase
MTTRVSIITPYRDAADFLAEAIESVLAQTVSGWELLLVDDRSSDAGVAIARDYAARDPRIRMLDTAGRERTGAAAARNVGLAAAHGEFVAFLDADDLLLPGKLEQELGIAERFPQAALICGTARWQFLGSEGSDWIDRVRHVATGIHEPPRLLETLILLRTDQVPCTCAVLARRDAVIGAGGFEESLKLYEDQSVWVKLFARYPAYLGGHLTSIYRQHADSTSARAERAGEYHRTRLHPARAAFLDWVDQYLRSERLEAPSTMRALRLAQALLRRDTSSLSMAERVQYAWLIQRDFGRRAQSRVKRVLRRLDRGSQRLSPTLP